MISRIVIGLILACMTSVSYSQNNPSFLIYDHKEKKTLASQNESTVRSIASLTKLMTALLIWESKLDMAQLIPYHGRIFPWKKARRSELLESLLVRSDNHAAEALAKSWPGGREAFISAMNSHAIKIGMLDTVFTDPSGLGRTNYSTANDLSLLVGAVSKYKELSSISTMQFMTIEKKTGKKITRVLLNNTNKQLLFEFENILVSKTGWTSAAGRCLALMVENYGNKYTVIILGEKSITDRETKARNLINNYITK